MEILCAISIIHIIELQCQKRQMIFVLHYNIKIHKFFFTYFDLYLIFKVKINILNFYICDSLSLYFVIFKIPLLLR